VAGSNGEVRFEPAALKKLYQGSGGFPRLINILAHKALLLGYGQGTKTITARHVKLAIADTEGARKGGFWQNSARRWLLGAFLASVTAAALAFHYLESVLLTGAH
jgi:MSHA biogenesis protein MshM